MSKINVGLLNPISLHQLQLNKMRNVPSHLASVVYPPPAPLANPTCQARLLRQCHHQQRQIKNPLK